MTKDLTQTSFERRAKRFYKVLSGVTLALMVTLVPAFAADPTGDALGAVTKLSDPPANRLVRVFNFKYPYEYISRFSQLLERKKEILRFYREK